MTPQTTEYSSQNLGVILDTSFLTLHLFQNVWNLPLLHSHCHPSNHVSCQQAPNGSPVLHFAFSQFFYEATARKSLRNFNRIMSLPIQIFYWLSIATSITTKSFPAVHKGLCILAPAPLTSPVMHRSLAHCIPATVAFFSFLPLPTPWPWHPLFPLPGMLFFPSFSQLVSSYH